MVPIPFVLARMPYIACTCLVKLDSSGSTSFVYYSEALIGSLVTVQVGFRFLVFYFSLVMRASKLHQNYHEKELN